MFASTQPLVVDELFMSLSERRFQRYHLTPGAFSRQRIRGTGLLAGIKGWKDCRVKDMSVAGALILAKQEHQLGSKIEVELETTDGTRMVFLGEVVNLGKDHNSNEHKIGMKIQAPKGGSAEAEFLDSLESRFKASA
ncbi:hypothetical protein ASC85_08720 [Pseudomonas sp. Root401]|nr:hypothetical protein ASC85_08720 [Pseudomonas sp. Root401]